jgi:hypothetical protein
LWEKVTGRADEGLLLIDIDGRRRRSKIKSTPHPKLSHKGRGSPLSLLPLWEKVPGRADEGLLLIDIHGRRRRSKIKSTPHPSPAAAAAFAAG